MGIYGELLLYPHVLPLQKMMVNMAVARKFVHVKWLGKWNQRLNLRDPTSLVLSHTNHILPCAETVRDMGVQHLGPKENPIHGIGKRGFLHVRQVGVPQQKWAVSHWFSAKTDQKGDHVSVKNRPPLTKKGSIFRGYPFLGVGFKKTRGPFF